MNDGGSVMDGKLNHKIFECKPTDEKLLARMNAMGETIVRLSNEANAACAIVVIDNKKN